MRDDRPGVYFYTGTTQTGKSKRAIEDAWRDRDATGWPILVIDSQGVWNFKSWVHVDSVEEAVRRLWKSPEELAKGGKRENVAIIPRDETQVDQLFAAARAGGEVVVLVDEARFWLSKRRISDSLSRGLRVWAHSRLVLRFTTQRVADIHNDALACHREVYVFKTVDPADLDTLWDRYKIAPEEAKALKPDSGGTSADGEFITIRWAEAQREGKLGRLKTSSPDGEARDPLPDRKVQRAAGAGDRGRPPFDGELGAGGPVSGGPSPAAAEPPGKITGT